MADIAPAEYLYELWDANWDDGPLGNYKIRRHPITKKTARRIYFTYGNGRTSFVNRQQIETDGEIYHGYTRRHLHLKPPAIPGIPKGLSLAELKALMVGAHPDRGGTDAEFIAARQRYEKARRTTT